VWLCVNCESDGMIRTLSAVDDNECELSTACPHGQDCVNTLGSYRCKHQSGFRVTDEGHKGNTTAITSTKLYFQPPGRGGDLIGVCGVRTM